MKVKETKVYQLFACLGVQERKDFARFLSQHSKPKKRKLRASLRFLCAQSAAIAEGQRSNEDWWGHVFPESPFHAPSMRKHQNALTIDLEAFLVDRKLRKEQDPFLAQLRAGEQLMLLLAGLLERGEDALFASYAKRAAALIERLPQDGDGQLLRYRFELLRIAFKQKTKPFTPLEEFVRGQEAIDQFYVLHSLRLELASRNQKRLNSQQQSLGRMEVVQSLLGRQDDPDPFAGIYLQVLALGDDFRYEDLEACLELIRQQASRIAPDAWRDLLYILLNLAIRRINEGQALFRVAALNVYLLLLEAGVLQKDLVAFRSHLLNAIQLALTCHQNERLAGFVQAQRPMMEKDEEFRNALLFYQCLESFSAREYTKASTCFMRFWLLESDRKLRYAAGVYILRSQYELNEIDHLRQFAGDFQRIISHDNRMDEARKASYREFFQAMRVLCRIHFNGLTSANKTHLKALAAKAQESPLLISRSWILEKIEQLWKVK